MRPEGKFSYSQSFCLIFTVKSKCSLPAENVLIFAYLHVILFEILLWYRRYVVLALSNIYKPLPTFTKLVPAIGK